MVKVLKFGGSSLADAEQFRKVAAIINAEPERRYVVASAPGKRFFEDEKVTDLLLHCHALATDRNPFDETFRRISDRFNGIIKDLGLSLNIQPELDQVKEAIQNGIGKDYVASRGEYFNSMILADFLQVPFLDAAECIFFGNDGKLDSKKTHTVLENRLAMMPRAVIPGFYGILPGGEIKTFSRGGSDITGSIVAEAIEADIYENWTDVSGMLMADPRIIDNPAPIDIITYRELRELSYMGATVLHEDAVFPVRRSGIPINIRNTNRPEDKGTMIVSHTEEKSKDRIITGVAGKTGFTAIYIERDMMNSELGYGRRVLETLERRGINFEHLPSGIDTVTVVVNSKELEGKLDLVVADLKRAVRPDTIRVYEDLAMVAVVGRGMISEPGVAAKVFTALAKEHINIRMIDQGSSELNIIVGIAAKDYLTALKAIYKEFEPKKL
ncbi:MAG: aspartate kinase [Clostridia bacterium]|nr:aspartate kinase [Clostridia bacterium]